jgi:lipopolysaccharide/colanic/teichoic acid biosynthesis glycosyltransferase
MEKRQEAALAEYVNGDDAAFQEAKRLGYHPGWCNTWMHQINYLFRQVDQHKYAYDYETLEKILVEVGFVSVVKRDFRLDSSRPVLFRQERMGLRFRAFLIYKFRTIVPDAPLKGGSITVGRDPRITRVGHFLRKTKVDEFPQLLNVLKGDMSFVGPLFPERRPVQP